MIRLDSVSYSYNGTGPVLKDISVQIEPGEYLALVGGNGCGKTTFLRLMNGLLSPSGGRVTVDGIDTKDHQTLPKVRQLVGMVFQNPDTQIVGMTVEEDIAFGPGNLGLPPEEVRRRVKRSLEKTGIRNLAHRAPHSLSNGEKQMVAIAGVLAMEPGYLVLDEATAYLDPAGRTRILNLVSELNREGFSVVHVTHDMDEAARAGRVLVMGGGKLLMDGPPEEIFEKAEELSRVGLGVPAAAELALRLRAAGMQLPAGILTMEDAEAAIFELLAVRDYNK